MKRCTISCWSGSLESAHILPLLMPIPFPQRSPEKPNTPSATLYSCAQANACTLASADNGIIGKTTPLNLEKMLTIILQGMSSPSSSVPTVSDLSNNIRTAVVVGGDGLIKDISQLLDLINKEQKKPSHPNAAQLSLIFLKLKEFLSEGTNVVKCIIVSQGNTFVLSLIQGIRSIHGYPLYFCGPKYLGEIRNPFYQRKGVGPNVKQLKEATELIVEGSINCSASIKTSIMCCTHTNTSIL